VYVCGGLGGEAVGRCLYYHWINRCCKQRHRKKDGRRYRTQKRQSERRWAKQTACEQSLSTTGRHGSQLVSIVISPSLCSLQSTAVSTLHDLMITIDQESKVCYIKTGMPMCLYHTQFDCLLWLIAQSIICDRGQRAMVAAWPLCFPF
jgi:hypothetical protein